MRTAFATGLLGLAASSLSLANPIHPRSASDSSITYDYIVVGGGTAGITAASRLAESLPNKSVLLLERGYAPTAAQGSNATLPWNNTVTPADVPGFAYYRDLNSFCPDTASGAGCVLGGGGSVNALVFVPPRSGDFGAAGWPAGWTWEDGVAESAARVYARNPGKTLPSADGERYNQQVFEVFSGFLASNGWRHVDAIAQPDDKHDMYSYPPWNVDESIRAGPIKTYLPIAQALPNFSLRLHAKALRIVRTGSLATGVEIENEDGSREVLSSNNIVLAAGAMSTPRILFNSGVGPASQIQIVANGTTNITLPEQADWIDLPVGVGIRDHPIFYINLNLTAPDNATTPIVPAQYNFNSPSAEEVSLYNTGGAGVLAQGPQRMIFWTSREVNGTTRFFQGTVIPNLENQIQVAVYLTHGLTSEGVLGITPQGATEFTTAPWLTAPEDRDAVLRFLAELLEMLKADGGNKWTPTDWLSGKEILDASELLPTFTAGAHFVATAKLGEVVDLNAKVMGLDNVFVVDASIHPELPTGNTNAMVMVVAEHAVEKIIALASY